MSAMLIFEFERIPDGITEDAMKTTIESMGEETWYSHEMILPKEVRRQVAVRVRIDNVSFFILKRWETYAISKDIPTCLKKAYELLGRIRNEIGAPGISLREIQTEYSKTRGILSYALPYITWFIGSYLGKIGTLNIWIVVTVIYMIFATLIEGREQIYSWLLLRYYADP